MSTFDWLGAATFAHWNFSGPSRVCYSILQTLISLVILGILSWLIKLVLDATSTMGTSATSTMGASEDASKTGFSGVAMGLSVLFGIAAWIWTLSFSAACYEHFRNLAPNNETQKTAEGPKV